MQLDPPNGHPTASRGNTSRPWSLLRLLRFTARLPLDGHGFWKSLGFGLSITCLKSQLPLDHWALVSLDKVGVLVLADVL